MNQENAAVKELFLIIALLLIFIIAARTPIDSDLWWHLRAGETTVRTLKPITEDQFSYTRLSQPWINHSWLSQVLLFFSFRIGNYILLSLLVAVLAVASMYLIYQQMLGAALSRTFLLTAGGIVASVVWISRPQMFSFLFLALLTYIFFMYQENHRKLFVILIPTFILWSNLHGGYFLGIIYLCCLLAGMVINKIFVGGSQVKTWRVIAEFALLIIVSYLATAVNPNGISMWVIPFKTVGVSGLQRLISEWASPDFHQPVQQLFLLYFFVTVFIIGFSEKKKNLDELLLFCCFGIMAFIARRNFGPFIIISLPILSYHFDGVLFTFMRGNPFLKRAFEKPSQDRESGAKIRIVRYINAAILFLLGFAGVLKLIFVNQVDLVEQFKSEMYPQGAVEWIQTNHPSGRLINEYDWGGYLIWELRDYPVFIDGRTDLFGDEIMNDWLAIVQCGDGWDGLLEEWAIDFMLIRPDRQIVQCALHEGWEMVYSDERSIVLTRDTHSND